jgi:predicted DsbA family dithiol-disulfide isomerase
VDVEIWSDVACPWCYIGKRRFEAALEQFEHRDEVNVTWRSFELDPSAPHERTGDRAERLAEKYGMTIQQARDAEEGLTAVAAGEGVPFRFDIARSGNTFDAHRLLHLAAAHDLQDELKERLMAAYHSEGEAIGDSDALRRLAIGVGLPEDEVAEVLAGDRYATEVRDDENVAREFGITGVPFFVVDRAFAASGAQSPEILGELLRRAWEAEPVASAAVDGTSRDTARH